MKFFHLLIIIIFGSTLCRAQTFAIHHYGIPEGLPSSEVYHIFQDSKGFLWFSTDNGVVKYDGFKFKTFNIAEGLPDPVIFETMEDPTEKIWFRTFSGRIAYIKNEKIFAYQYNKPLAKICEGSYLASMAFDNQGQLAFSTATKIGTVSASGKVSIETTPLGSVACKKVGTEYVIASSLNRENSPLLRIDNKTAYLHLSKGGTNTKVHSSIKKIINWKNNLYLSINNDIFKYDGTNASLVYSGTAPIISLSIDSNENLWVGLLSGGTERYHSTEFTNPWIPEFIGKNSVTKVLQDHEGGIWISTLENGIFHLPNYEIKHYALNSASKIKTVSSTEERIFIGEYDGNFHVLDSKSKKKIHGRKFDRPILTFFTGNKKKNNVWVSTAEATYLLNEKNEEIKKIPIVTYTGITQDDNDAIWAIDARGVSKLDQQGNVIYTRLRQFTHRNIIAFDSVLLISLHTGINIYDHQLNLIKAPQKLEKFKISKINHLTDSVFFVGTIGNGFLLTNKHFEQFRHFQLPARNIYDLVLCDSTVWLATEKGILKASLQSVINGQNDYQFITNKSGLLNDQVNHLVKGKDEIVAFYNNSFSTIPQSQKYDNQIPTFYAKGIKVNNQNFAYSDRLDLPYNRNNIQLDFGFISFNHQNILTRYRLSPTESWNYLSERKIDLYSLGAGNYPIELQYSIDNIHWTKAAQIPVIYISPAWWQTIEFQAPFIIGMIALIYLFFNNRLVIYRQRNEKMRLLSIQQQQLIQTEIETLERERNRIAKDLHDSVGTNILATKLTVNRLLKKHQEPEGEAVEQQFQETMIEIKEIIYNLSPPGLERYGLATGLKNYIDRISTSTVVSFNVNTFGKDLNRTTLSIPLFRILQELITNSLKHSQSKSISIHLNSFDDLYNIVYEDKGKGFSMEGNHKGLGLQNIESRVKSINGKMSFESGPFGISYSIDVPLK